MQYNQISILFLPPTKKTEQIQNSSCLRKQKAAYVLPEREGSIILNKNVYFSIHCLIDICDSARENQRRQVHPTKTHVSLGIQEF